MSNLINYFHEYLFASLPYSMDLIIILCFILETTFYKDALLAAKKNTVIRMEEEELHLFIRIYNELQEKNCTHF